MRLTLEDVISTPPEQPVQPTQQATQQPVEPVNTSTSTESVDVSGVQDRTNQMIQAMRNEGLTYAQAFEKYNPKPVQSKGIQNTQKLQKAAVIADMIRLATEGAGAFAGADVQKNTTNTQGMLAQRLLQQYAEYNKNLQDWQAKGVDAAAKDVQLANKLYERNLAAAPKTRTTVQDNAWDRKKHEEDTKAANKRAEDANRAANQRAAQSNATRIQAAQIAKEGRGDDEKGLTTIVLGDNSGSAKISKAAEKSFYNAAYQVMLNDPAFMNVGNATSKELQKINDDVSFEGKAAKIRVYVDQHLHESPKALELLQSNAVEFNRNTPQQQTQQTQASGAWSGWQNGTPKGKVREKKTVTPAEQRGGVPR